MKRLGPTAAAAIVLRAPLVALGSRPAGGASSTHATTQRRAMSATAPTLFRRRKAVDESTPWKRLDALGAGANEPGDANDPEGELEADVGATLLKALETSDLSAEEFEMQCATAAKLYDPAVYSYLMMGSVDIVHEMVQQKLIPKEKAAASVSHWFCDPIEVIYDPSVVQRRMGEARWERTQLILKSLLKLYRHASPLRQALLKHNLPQDAWVPLLRYLMVRGSKRRQRDANEFGIVEFAAAVVQGNVHCAAYQALGLPGDKEQRTAVLGWVLLGASGEFGDKLVSLVGVLLVQMSGVVGAVNLNLQREVMKGMGRDARRRMEWQSRRSGALQKAAAAWILTYYNQVKKDIQFGIEHMTADVALEDAVQGEDEEEEGLANDLPAAEPSPELLSYEARVKMEESALEDAVVSLATPSSVEGYLRSAKKAGHVPDKADRSTSNLLRKTIDWHLHKAKSEKPAAPRVLRRKGRADADAKDDAAADAVAKGSGRKSLRRKLSDREIVEMFQKKVRAAREAVKRTAKGPTSNKEVMEIFRRYAPPPKPAAATAIAPLKKPDDAKKGPAKGAAAKDAGLPRLALALKAASQRGSGSGAKEQAAPKKGKPTKGPAKKVKKTKAAAASKHTSKKQRRSALA